MQEAGRTNSLNLPLLVLSGSTQPESQSLKVAQAVCGYLKSRGGAADLVDLHTLNLPFVGATPADQNWRLKWQKTQKICQEAAGLVIISPEYNGGPSPAILNFMLYIKDELRHKPALLVGVSAGRGGAYPIAALRQNGCKDTGYVVLPESVIVSQVNACLNDRSLDLNEDLKPADLEVRQALRAQLHFLQRYAASLQALRHQD